MSNKSLLEELCVKNGWCKPKYSTTKQGPDHEPQFTSTVVVNDVSFKSQGFRRPLLLKQRWRNMLFPKPTSPQPKSQVFLNSRYQVKVGNVSRAAGRLTWKDTYTTPKKKGVDEMERLLDQERKIWNQEKLQLEMKNLELANAIEVKSNENQRLEKKLQHCLHMKDMEQRKTERFKSLLEEKQEENEKLHKEVAEMKKQFQAVSGDAEGGQKTLGLTDSSKKEQSYKDEHETRKVLIKALYGSKESIGVKILGDLDWKAFQFGAKREYCVKEEINVRAKELCAIWESHIGDPHWKPFKTITDMKGKNKEIIDEKDEKLKKLKIEQGDKAYEAVITALLETKEYNHFGGYKVEELWNFQLGRKASLMEGVKYLLKQLDLGNTNKRPRN